ncbi:MAG: acetyl-CoA carboxylase carboxyltransferase subunit alpha [Pyrinomonadaceae bacterium]
MGVKLTEMEKQKKSKTAFERVQTARHPDRPYTLDLITADFEDFIELRGDRRYADDAAIICGFARIEKFEVAVIGQQKGRDMNQRRHRNFGMPKPEGYRKALRLMQLAEKFGRPVITFIDTPGAYPGIDAEERGQAEAIAYNLRVMAGLKVPTIVLIIGEGGSGGALAIGVGDRVLMLENAVYSVITPEGCAAILWKDAGQAVSAAESLRLTADDLQKFNLIDEVIPEMGEWRFTDDKDNNSKKEKSSFERVSKNIKNALIRHLEDLCKLPPDQRMSQRYQKFRKMGEFD